MLNNLTIENGFDWTTKIYKVENVFLQKKTFFLFKLKIIYSILIKSFTIRAFVITLSATMPINVSSVN